MSSGWTPRITCDDPCASNKFKRYSSALLLRRGHVPWDSCGDSMIAMTSNACRILQEFVLLRINPADMWEIINSCPDPQVRLFMAVFAVQSEKEMLDEGGFTEYCLNNQGMILG